MTLTETEQAQAAEDLYQAEIDGRQIGLLSRRFANLDMDDAYAIQSALTQRKLAAGCRSIGWKIGLTSKAMQYALNIDIPDSGITHNLHREAQMPSQIGCPRQQSQ